MTIGAVNNKGITLGVGLGGRGWGDTDYVVSYVELKSLLPASRQSLWQYRGAYLDDRSAGSVIGSDAFLREWLFKDFIIPCL